MSLWTYIKRLVKAIFGIDMEQPSTTTPTVQKTEETFNYAEARKRLSEGAKELLITGHPLESERDSILKQVELNEAAGHNKYIIEVNSAYYVISNGTFAHYPKGPWMDLENGSMPKTMIQMITLRHDKVEDELILKQIADNKAAGIKDYKIEFEGGYYIVKNNKIVANM